MDLRWFAFFFFVTLRCCFSGVKNVIILIEINLLGEIGIYQQLNKATLFRFFD